MEMQISLIEKVKRAKVALMVYIGAYEVEE